MSIKVNIKHDKQEEFSFDTNEYESQTNNSYSPKNVQNIKTYIDDYAFES